MPFELFKLSHNNAMWDVLYRPNVYLRLAQFEGIDEILGFAVIEPPCLTAHFVYVKKDFRRQHIAKALLKGDGVRYYNYYTKTGIKLANSLNLQYNPYYK
jgi:GNAT superfamily N-acetyltransferase